MKNFFTYNLRTFKAEWLKLKRTGIFWICFSAGAFIPLIFTIVLALIEPANENQDQDTWNSFIEQSLKGFTGFFFPIFLIIIVARIVYLEHRSDTWKLLETQPVSKAALYFGKWQVMILLSLSCLLILTVFTLAGGFILQLTNPKIGLDKASINWAIIPPVIFRFWIASFGIITIQYFIGLWNKSFALPLTIGLAATIAGPIFSSFDIMNWWPYSATANTSSSYSGSQTGNFLMHHEKMSLLWAGLFLFLGYNIYVQKGFLKGLIFPFSRLILTLIVIGSFTAIARQVNKPFTLKPYSKTVLAGKIKTENPLENIVLFEAPAFDTLFKIPVKDGKFHFSPTQPIDAGVYYFQIDGHKVQAYFGTNDSIFIDATLSERKNDVKISGTRIAENAYLKENERQDFYYLENYAYNYKPENYAKELIKTWEKGLKKIREFKTSDNIQPSEKFRKVQEKLLAIKLLRLAEVVYPKVYSLYYPNEKFKQFSGMENIKNAADINDKELAGYNSFVDYLSETFREKSGPNDSIYFSFIQTQIKEQKLKNLLFFNAVNEVLPKIKDSTIRNNYLTAKAKLISNERLRNNLRETNTRLKNISRGMPAYNFITEALTEKEITLAQFAGRFVVVDVWATWCGPCKTQSPYFEQLAEKYTTDKVAFMAISIDDKKQAWKMEAPSKSNRVLQLWAKNADLNLKKPYAITGIPRFMLIDPNGNILNALMPPPSSSDFESILLKEIPGLRQNYYNSF